MAIAGFHRHNSNSAAELISTNPSRYETYLPGVRRRPAYAYAYAWGLRLTTANCNTRCVPARNDFLNAT